MAANQPVYMIVIGRIRDREKMGKYQAALMESGLYPKNQGGYRALGRPLDVFEGDIPDNQAYVVAEFPSLEHAQSFWNSDAYQNDIKPLREGAGDFDVVVIPTVSAAD